MKAHLLPDCFLVWYGSYLSRRDGFIEEICDQGYADYYLDGINKVEAKQAMKEGLA